MTEEYFPESGERVTVNIGHINYTEELWKIEKLVTLLLEEDNIVSSVDSWLIGFRDYVESNNLFDGIYVVLIKRSAEGEHNGHSNTFHTFQCGCLHISYLSL